MKPNTSNWSNFCMLCVARVCQRQLGFLVYSRLCEWFTVERRQQLHCDTAFQQWCCDSPGVTAWWCVSGDIHQASLWFTRCLRDDVFQCFRWHSPGVSVIYQVSLRDAVFQVTFTRCLCDLPGVCVMILVSVWWYVSGDIYQVSLWFTRCLHDDVFQCFRWHSPGVSVIDQVSAWWCVSGDIYQVSLWLTRCLRDAVFQVTFTRCLCDLPGVCVMICFRWHLPGVSVIYQVSAWWCVSGDIHQVSLCSAHASVIYAGSTQWLHVAIGDQCKVQITRPWCQTGEPSYHQLSGKSA